MRWHKQKFLEANKKPDPKKIERFDSFHEFLSLDYSRAEVAADARHRPMKLW